jgi:YggT family protein
MYDLISLIDVLFQLLNLLIIARVILSWVPGLGYDHPVTRVLHRLTSPILDPIRRVLPPVAGFDLSPIVAILVLQLVHQLLRGVLVAL